MQLVARFLVCSLLVLGLVAPRSAAQPATESDNPIVEIVISYRSSPLEEDREVTVVIELFPDEAPETVDYFITLSDAGFYDGTQFHEVVADLFIQGGDANSKDDNPFNDGEGAAGDTVALEPNDELSHVRGAVGLARDPGNPTESGTQFYMLSEAMPERDGDYTIFGMIQEGQQVVDEVSNLETVPTTDRPVLPATIVDVVVIEAAPDPALDQEPQPPIVAVTMAVIGVVAIVIYFTRRTMVRI